MKNFKSIKFALLTVGTVLFTLIFWKESLGINTLIFSVFILGITYYLFPEAKKSFPTILVSFGILISSSLIVYHASELAVFVWIVSIFFLPAFAQNPNLKTFIYGFFSSFLSYILVPGTLANNLKSDNSEKPKNNKFWRFIKLVIVPIIVLFLFYWIFKLANPIFDKFTNTFFKDFNDLIVRFFSNFSFIKILFILWGFSILGWIIYKSVFPFIEENEKKQKLEIFRTRNNVRNFEPNWKTKLNLGLKNEYRSAVLLVIMVNVLLLIINIIDINWVWFNFKYSSDMNLTQFVHEGTYLLILSIFLSMGIMLYFFRKNQNFYPKRKVLQTVTYIWIFQNAILLTSVVFRNLHYINYFGLAYKRIGLFFFLAMVIIGLITLCIKIKHQKTGFYLLKVNTFALYIGFVVFAIPDWDTIITKYNLSYCLKSKIDVSFLLTLDDKVIPILEQNKTIFTNKNYYSDDLWSEAQNAEDFYITKKENFIKSYSSNTWLSWNYMDWKSYNFFKK